MQHQQTAINQFVKDLQVVVNQPIWRVIHPADGWLFLDLGKRYQDYISNETGSEKPYTKGIYQLYIRGNWQIIQGKAVVESRTVKPSESQEDYFSRMENIANDFPIKSISRVVHYGKSIVFNAGDGYQLEVDISDHDDSLRLTTVQLDKSNKPVDYRHFEYSEE